MSMKDEIHLSFSFLDGNPRLDAWKKVEKQAGRIIFPSKSSAYKKIPRRILSRDQMCPVWTIPLSKKKIILIQKMQKIHGQSHVRWSIKEKIRQCMDILC